MIKDKFIYLFFCKYFTAEMFIRIQTCFKIETANDFVKKVTFIGFYLCIII